MKQYKEQLLREQLITRLAQAKEQVNPIQAPSDAVLNALTKETEEWIMSRSVRNVITDNVAPYTEKAVEEFVEKNRDKAADYAANPDLLVRDIQNQIQWFQYINYLTYSLDAALIASSVVSLAATIFSGGTAAPATVPIEVAKWGARKALKKTLRQRGKEILTKIMSKQALKVIRRKGLAAGGQFSKFFLQEASFHLAVLSSLNLMSSVATDVGVTAVKNIIAEKGVSEFNLPKQYVNAIAKPHVDQSAFNRITQSFIKKTERDLKKLFTTQAGLRNLAFGMALRKLWSVRAIKSKIARMNMRANVKMLLRDRKYFNAAYLSNALSGKFDREKQREEELLSNRDLLELIRGSQIPELLHNDYVEYLGELIEKETDPNAARKVIEEKLQATDLTIDAIQDEIIELGTLDFIEENQKTLTTGQLDDLLRSVIDLETISARSLIDRYQVKSLSELVNYLKDEKRSTTESLIKRMCVDRKSRKLQEQLMRHFVDEASLSTYKRNLAKEVGRGQREKK